MSKVIKGGTIITADRSYTADIKDRWLILFLKLVTIYLVVK